MKTRRYNTNIAIKWALCACMLTALWGMSFDVFAKATTKPATQTAKKAQKKGRWEVHEWGTFTSTQGSDGKLLEGMHHEEERLPRFVHNLAGAGRGRITKGIPKTTPPAKVTQRLETPVIYFYTDRPRKVEVKVDFPKGVISEWYPDAAHYRSNLSKPGWIPAKGSMTWKGEVKNGPASFPYVHPTNIWTPSRHVPDAAPFHTTGRMAYRRRRKQAERFIFYRGIGRFRSWVRVSTEKGKLWTLHNRSEDTIPSGIVLNVTSLGGSWRAFGPIKGKSQLTVKAPGTAMHRGMFLHQVKRALVKQLMRSGLTKDESWAMVHTWHSSYFKLPGKRVLYIVPRVWTDRLLPIKITPKPNKLVRTLVGRIEFLTPDDESSLLYHFKNFYASNRKNYNKLLEDVVKRRERLRKSLRFLKNPIEKKHVLRRMKNLRPDVESFIWELNKILGWGRLTEPKLRRMMFLLKGKKIKSFCKELIRDISRQAF
ncbi:MAG: hypothetical protein CL920_39575 [Deltaproteobacteria bacterium]|nr:hypothetical protein [Deltaproteobacteria bacterium]MBU54836.1 hypothetical protein [Deltaproteobacteria bacterium]